MTELTHFSNYSDYEKKYCAFPWSYLMELLPDIKTDTLIIEQVTDLGNGRILVSMPGHHGPFEKVVIKIGDDVSSFSFMSESKRLNERNARVIITDRIRAILYGKEFVPINRRYKPKGYNEEKEKWRIWDELNEKW